MFGQKRLKLDKTNFLIKNKLFLCNFLTLFLIIVILSFSQNTFAYFSDTAISVNQSFEAGYWVPVLNPIGYKSGIEGQMLQFTISAIDPNGDTLTYSVDNLPSGATLNTNTGLFSWPLSLGDAGTYTGIHFEVSDGKYIDSENITITIAEAPAVVISDITVLDTTINSAIISWQTSESVASSVVVYGLMEDDYANTSSGTILTGDFYSVQLESLSADIPYYFKIKIIDNLGREVFSDENTFTTSPEEEEEEDNEEDPPVSD